MPETSIRAFGNCPAGHAGPGRFRSWSGFCRQLAQQHRAAAGPACRASAAAPPPGRRACHRAEEGGTSFGSGTLVDVHGDYGLVLTNWHVVADATHTIEVLFPDGFRTAARVITTDRTWDLAALAVWRPQVEPVRLASRPPQPGEPLTIAGYGSGNYRAITGKCTQYVAPAMNKPYEMVELSVAARQGDSGGPIFNSQENWQACYGAPAGNDLGKLLRSRGGLRRGHHAAARRGRGTKRLADRSSSGGPRHIRAGAIRRPPGSGPTTQRVSWPTIK